MVPPSMLLAFSCLSVTIHATTAPIPLPSGPYGVSLGTGELTDRGQPDPYDPLNQDRRLMLSAFYPVSARKNCDHITSPYMPPVTSEVYNQLYSTLGLPNGTFGSLELTLCNATTVAAGKRPRSKYPVVIFSPGLGNSRLLYSSIAASLASQGFVVLTVDHPHDAAVVEYSDGSSVLAANITSDEQIEQSLQVRAKDISFVIRSLRNIRFSQTFLKGLYGEFDVETIFLHGHSLGGATAAETMYQNKQVRAAINLDGSFFGEVVNHGLDRPFMILAHEGKSLETDISWSQLWSRLIGPKVMLAVNGTAHGSYTDFPILVDVLGIRDMLPSDILAPLVGTIPGERLLEIVSAETKVFFDFVRCQVTWKQLQTKLGHFSEATILKESSARGRC